MPVVKTAELIGPALDWAVGVCEGRKPSVANGLVRATAHRGAPDSPPMFGPELHYSTLWAQGWPVMARERISFKGRWRRAASGRLSPLTDWKATSRKTGSSAQGETALIAAMRCYVASKLGDEVEIPAELEGL